MTRPIKADNISRAGSRNALGAAMLCNENTDDLSAQLRHTQRQWRRRLFEHEHIRRVGAADAKGLGGKGSPPMNHGRVLKSPIPSQLCTDVQPT